MKIITPQSGSLNGTMPRKTRPTMAYIAPWMEKIMLMTM